jgi:hypothetical protein
VFRIPDPATQTRPQPPYQRKRSRKGVVRTMTTPVVLTCHDTNRFVQVAGPVIHV